MNAVEFIENNIVSELTKQGYEETVARQGANYAVDYFRRCSSATKKGGMFDDYLKMAQGWAAKLQPKKKVK